MASAPPPPISDPSPRPTSTQTRTMTVEETTAIWSKAIETQMHFNEMATKSRQLGLAFATAALGVAVLLLGQGDEYALVFGNGLRLHATALVLIAAIVAVWAVQQLDLVYHQMLRGAVAFGEDFEETHMKKLFGLEKGLTQAISHFSRSSEATTSGSPKTYSGKVGTTAGDKVRSFYRKTMAVLWISVGAVVLVTNLGGSHVERREAAPDIERDPPELSTGNSARTLNSTARPTDAPAVVDAPTTRVEMLRIASGVAE